MTINHYHHHDNGVGRLISKVWWLFCIAVVGWWGIVLITLYPWLLILVPLAVGASVGLAILCWTIFTSGPSKR